jgi:cold shock protein
MNQEITHELTGTVKWFDEKKGFGFLTSEAVKDSTGNRRDIFVHYKHIVMEGYKSLVRGELVVFDSVVTDKGVMATKVKKVGQ